MANNNTSSNMKSTQGVQLEDGLDHTETNLKRQLGDQDTFDDADPTLENYAAIMATNKPNPRGPGYIKLYLLSATIFLCSTMSGFDSSLMGSINALPNYTEYFGLPPTGNTSTGIVFAIFQVGQIAAAFFVWLLDWYGRIWHIFFGCLGVIVGTVITGLATDLPTFIGGRFLLSFFATLTTTAAPLYLVEISPAAYRSSIAGLFNTFYYVGSILATSSVYGCHKYLSDRPGNLDWRIPVWLQAVCATLVLLVIKFFPESPRYLVLIDKHEEARQIITKYHTNGDPNHPLVELQMTEMVRSVQGTPKATWKDLLDLTVLFETRSNRYRLMLNMVFSWFAQFSGNNIISYYLPVMLDAVGVKDTNTKLILNIIYSAIGWVFSTGGARLHDIVGRRKMLMGSTSGMALCLALVAAGSAGKIEYDNNAAATLSIVFIFVFGAIFSGAFTPMQPVYPAEVVSNRMRAKAMGAYKITSGAAGFLNTFVAPIALSSIGYWFYVFFVFWDIFEFAFIYFFFVETKGLTLEELDVIFEADNPRKASIKAKKKLKTLYKASEKKEETAV
ncbi:lactose permease [Xylaria venustula]|nr:lactose permease [Xylaria venustula]